jgi:DNA gyrase subunit A
LTDSDNQTPKENTNKKQSIVPILIDTEMQNSYLDYAMSVIVSRALPDVRDGLKPVHRRILYAMHKRGWTHSKAYVKCAKVVGEVIGNYHPHGDTAVYDTIVRMALEFAMRSMLIDGQGNFGSIDGDRVEAYTQYIGMLRLDRHQWIQNYLDHRLTCFAWQILAPF